MARHIINGESEYFLAVRAKGGDKDAFMSLWNLYKPVMLGMLRSCRWLTFDERSSEAVLLFAHKLEIFDPAKVGKSPENWTFSYMLTGGVKNLCQRLQRCFRDESKAWTLFDEDTLIEYLEDPVSSDHPLSKLISGSPIDCNVYDYCEKSNPEFLLMHSVTELQEKKQKLEERISPFQKKLLYLRREGKTIAEIADEMGKGVTTIKRYIMDAKKIASRIFGINYMKA
jgi:DNA-directed RNA polymerase specialized sigma24 family protein